MPLADSRADYDPSSYRCPIFNSACISDRFSHMLPCRRDGTAADASDIVERRRKTVCGFRKKRHSLDNRAPNAILERMRRRISRVGLLVAFVSSVLTALVIFAVFACASLR